jgi:hypothetical protein
MNKILSNLVTHIINNLSDYYFLSISSTLFRIVSSFCGIRYLSFHFYYTKYKELRYNGIAQIAHYYISLYIPNLGNITSQFISWDIINYDYELSFLQEHESKRCLIMIINFLILFIYRYLNLLEISLFCCFPFYYLLYLSNVSKGISIDGIEGRNFLSLTYLENIISSDSCLLSFKFDNTHS